MEMVANGLPGWHFTITAGQRTCRQMFQPSVCSTGSELNMMLSDRVSLMLFELFGFESMDDEHTALVDELIDAKTKGT